MCPPYQRGMVLVSRRRLTSIKLAILSALVGRIGVDWALFEHRQHHSRKYGSTLGFLSLSSTKHSAKKQRAKYTDAYLDDCIYRTHSPG